MHQRILLLSGWLLIATVAIAGCNVSASTSKPTTVITSPASNSQFREGEPIAVMSTVVDANGIAQVELVVDGTVVRTDTPPAGQTTSFSVIQTWTATPGNHTILVRATDTQGIASDPAGIVVTVLQNVIATPTAPPVATATPVPNRGCTNNSAFVADITVPDGTAVAAGQVFNKIWRVRNTGTCAWIAGDQLVFIGGEAMTTTTVLQVPATPAGGTADLLVAMTGPAAPGTHIGQWRIRGANGVFFGATLNVVVNVIVPVPPACAFNPVLHGFSASPSTITSGESTTLSWGFVEGAQSAEIDNGIGGVATPGNTSVSPSSTTTYTLTAICGGRVTTAQVTVTVNSPAPTATPAATNTSGPTSTPTRTPTVTSTP